MHVNNREYKTFLYYSDSDNINQIPELSGNYYFVHYVNIDSTLGVNESWKALRNFSSVDFDNSEEGKGQKYFYKVRELSFKDYNRNSVFGLKAERANTLLEYLSSSNVNLNKFLKYYRDLCFTRPFYIGKAQNLRSRISQHVRGNSNILNEIDKHSIDKDCVWISFEVIDQETPEILNIYEEIAQKFLKPSITEKFG